MGVLSSSRFGPDVVLPATGRSSPFAQRTFKTRSERGARGWPVLIRSTRDSIRADAVRALFGIEHARGKPNGGRVLQELFHIEHRSAGTPLASLRSPSSSAYNLKARGGVRAGGAG